MDHRKFVGGDFERIGKWQFDYLINNCLVKPETLFLDVACGSLRLGKHMIPFLNPGNYYGIDYKKEILDAGITNELQDIKILETYSPKFEINPGFDFSFCTKVDIAWANSLFSHLTPNDMTKCLMNIRDVTDLFVFTFFEGTKEKNPVESHPNKDFRYEFSYISELCNQAGWLIDRMDEQTHPRKQIIVKATKN